MSEIAVCLVHMAYIFGMIGVASIIGLIAEKNRNVKRIMNQIAQAMLQCDELDIEDEMEE